VSGVPSRCDSPATEVASSPETRCPKVDFPSGSWAQAPPASRFVRMRMFRQSSRSPARKRVQDGRLISSRFFPDPDRRTGAIAPVTWGLQAPDLRDSALGGFSDYRAKAGGNQSCCSPSAWLSEPPGPSSAVSASPLPSSAFSASPLPSSAFSASPLPSSWLS